MTKSMERLPIFRSTVSESTSVFLSAPGHLLSTATEASKRIVGITNGGPTGADDLAQLLQRFPQDEVAKRLCRLSGVKARDYAVIAEQLKKLVICQDETATAYVRFERLCRLHKDPQKHARSLIENAHNALGDGHFFVSDLVSRSELGFVVRMRQSIRWQKKTSSLRSPRSA